MKTLFLESEFKMPAGMVVLPLRSTVVKTSKGLIVISPIDFSPKQLQEIKSLGEVTDIVAPSMLHHKFVKQAISLFPSATVWGAPGLELKRADVRWDKIIGRDPWPYEADLPVVIVKGITEMEELAFFEKASKTLIVVDLLFNLQRPRGWAAPVMLRMMGTYKRFAMSRLVNRFMKDRKAFEVSLREIARWDFDRIVMAHGNVIESNGHSLFVKAAQERGYLMDQSS